MRPSMFMGAQGIRPAEYVGAFFQHNVGTPVGSALLQNIPGVAVGDYVFVVCATQSGSGYFTTSDAGWDVDNITFGSGYRSTVFRRKIVAVQSLSIYGSGVPYGAMMSAYSGASRAERRTVVNDLDIDTNSTTIPGFVRSADCVGVVSLFASRTEDITTAVPSGDFVRRGIDTPNHFTLAVGDALPRADYVDGQDVTWSNTGTHVVGMNYELRV